jgi:hypothetical protein
MRWFEKPLLKGSEIENKKKVQLFPEMVSV